MYSWFLLALATASMAESDDVLFALANAAAIATASSSGHNQTGRGTAAAAASASSAGDETLLAQVVLSGLEREQTNVSKKWLGRSRQANRQKFQKIAEG